MKQEKRLKNHRKVIMHGFLLSLCFLAFASAPPVYGHGSEGIVYGLVNMTVLMREVPEGVAFNKLVDSQIEDNKKRIVAARTALQELAKQLEEGDEKLEAEVKKNILEQQGVQLRIIRHEQGEIQKKAFTLREGEGKELYKKVRQYIEKVATEYDVLMVLDASKSGILVMKKENYIDLTAAVIEHAKNFQ